MSEKLERFTNLLKQIFELDKADLDFGIYRIMNLRKDTIENFLEKDLPKKVTETLAPYAQSDKETLKQEIGDLKKQAKDMMGMEIEELPPESPMVIKYNEKIKQLASGTDLSALESEVYSSLYSFFNRYYDEGDFISKRRYKEGVYAIPYEGEEVKLYWANQDQYYVKSSENFKDYTFIKEGITVHFRIVDATMEMNNNKEAKDKKRIFMLYSENDENPEIKTFEYNEEKHELYIRFIYDIPVEKIKQEDSNKQILTEVTKYISSLGKPELNPLILIDNPKDKKAMTPIAKQLSTYVAKNTFDYFVHKDLKGFLNRELDFFIKNEVMHLDDLDTENEQFANAYIAKVRTIKKIGRIIIDFLAQLENFQKKLWLKKKFIVSTNYCITLDKINESFYSEIANNKAQCEEWISLYSINEVEGWTLPPTIDFLKANQNLVIDTKNFNNQFKEKLVASFENIDEEIDGLMVNGDNYQVLSLLKNRFRNKIDSCYIDPPYNKEGDGFIYKDNYQDSSWLTMMSDRLQKTSQLMTSSSAIFISIDEKEGNNLRMLGNNIYGKDNSLGTFIWRKKDGGGQADESFVTEHEYVVSYKLSKDFIWLDEEIDDSEENYKHEDEKGKYSLTKLAKWGNTAHRYERPSMYFPLTAPDGTDIYPIAPDGDEGRWRVGAKKMSKLLEEKLVEYIKNKNTWIAYEKKYFDPKKKKKNKLRSILYKVGGTGDGTNQLTALFGKKDIFQNPKPTTLLSAFLENNLQDEDIIIDYFAGSGTTGNAVINLNRENETNIKYILVEMGVYFDTVTKPRMQKCVYSDSWKEGKPENRTSGISQLIKYMSLESYEDSLNNIELENSKFSSLFGDDYLINYMIDYESNASLLRIDNFKTPFDYQMKITEKNECKKHNIDLVETFNYLIGLTIQKSESLQRYNVTKKVNGIYEGAVDLVNDETGEFAFKEIKGVLPDGRRAIIIWRDVTENITVSNAALDAFFLKNHANSKDRDFEVIFTNCDNNLAALCSDKEKWTVEIIEKEFKQKMFEEQ